MRIERVELRTIALRLREPFRISSGTTHERRILLVQLHAGGYAGWGECVAGEQPYYSYETVGTAALVIREHLLPALRGRELAGVDGLAGALDEAAKGHRMAKAALEMAAWDAAARAQGVSLAELLGGRRALVAAGVSIGIQPDVPALLDRIAAFAAEGYRRVKVKIAPGWDIDVVATIRDRFPDLPLMVDANAAYGPADSARLRELDAFGLTMIEQPFAEDALLAHARLQAQLATPICLDETVTTPERCAEALALQCCRVVNIKPGRVGGHAAARRIHDLCADAGVPVWCGGMLESGIGRAHNVALASLANFRLPGDTSASRRYWQRDVVTPEFVLDAAGCIAVPTGSGIGVQIDEAYLDAITVDRTESVL
jgi:o-succinylbenzoate synthase